MILLRNAKLDELPGNTCTVHSMACVVCFDGASLVPENILPMARKGMQYHRHVASRSWNIFPSSALLRILAFHILYNSGLLSEWIWCIDLLAISWYLGTPAAHPFNVLSMVKSAAAPSRVFAYIEVMASPSPDCLFECLVKIFPRRSGRLEFRFAC